MAQTLRTASLAAKLGLVGAVLMVVALGSVALTLWVTWQLEGGAASVNEAGRLRMQTWRLAQATALPDAAERQRHVAQFDASLELLRLGDPERPLFLPADAATEEAFERVRRTWAGTRERWLVGSTEPAATSEAAVRAQALVHDIDTFVGSIESRLARWTNLLTLFQLTLMGLAIAAAIALMYSAWLFVFSPLARLERGQARLERGELEARVEVASHDEFGRVAEGFNRMAARLEESHRGLERKVAEKTERLRAERERLAVLYEASRFVAGAPTLEALAAGFATRMQQVAGAAAVLLRWHDQAHGGMVLLASVGVPVEMLERERCVKAGDCLCGGTAAAADEVGRLPGARVIPILAPRSGAHAARAEHGGSCHAHGFERLATLPVRAQERLVGEVDLLWREVHAPLAKEELALLESLAHLLAGGMEAMRVQALEREAAVSEERSLLARELHDSIAQGLAFMKIQVQLLRAALKKGEPARSGAALDELDAGVRESMADVRELLLHFRTRAAADDFVAALKTTMQKFQHQTGLPAALEVVDRGVPPPADVQVQLLHMVQEALSNVRKHARAARVSVRVQAQPNWRIEVHDDGCGFDTTAGPADETHVGLRILRERAAGIGAQVALSSAPGAGTTVSLEWPASTVVLRPQSVSEPLAA
jgi:two-component system nitrate/nitrite sensor histidine kinase NarX